ncbi:disintegrin and metalloproteinase domain-containing protein 12-like [Pomacea canaliculata]|uniref:disintegrin and metalloproteinase domain-containing protein 12-like n=1 Tax=Pomacea canaliculata TaxID=400727 RepID=UPI000D72F974|nr:disintegrin and metalloproteinase domain-containing protein 12-like [Pomacea canaliculata]
MEPLHPPNMAAFFIYLYLWLSIRSLSYALLAAKIYEPGKHRTDAMSKGVQPGVAVFEIYDDSDIHVYADGQQVFNTTSENGHFPNITLQFTAFGRNILLDLHLTRDLFSASYIKKLQHHERKFIKILHRKEHCYYQGSIRNSPNSHAAVSSCSGFRYRQGAILTDSEETYHIDPLNDTLHRVFRNSDRKKLPFQCGTNRHDIYQPPSAIYQDHARKKRSIHGPYDKNQYTRFVELYLVNDYRTFQRHKENADEVFRRSQDIANIVNSLYRQLNIYVVLVGVEVWGTGDKIGITSSADTTMENFLRYRKERINPYHPNDNAQLITGIHFDHGVVGKAIKGPICTHQFSGGVSMDYDGLVTLVATTVAHEIGHNFGMEHDNDTKCSCPEEKCIMAATSGQRSPQHWSSCSQNALHEAFELGMDYCLRNQPRIIFDGPVCGNGFVEDGEECDCGLPEDCGNRCCNATSCQLHSQAVCATGRCCNLETCKPRAASSLCREPVGECDLSEFCDGVSEFCPQDVFVENGVLCKGGQSYCYKGKCNTHNDQCQLLWGSTGRVSDPILLPAAQCTWRPWNVMCGLLHCVHLNEKLMFWRDNLALDMRANFLTRGNTQYVCRSAMLDVGLDMPDPGLVPDGAKCEENKSGMCPIQKLDIPQCPDCHGNGVCNSKGHCHCHVGYAPPLCDRPGFGGSIDSGPATNEYAKKDLLIGLLVLFLVILPLNCALILAYINRRRLISWWKLGPRFKFGILKKSQIPPQPPQPRHSTSISEKRWSAAPPKPSPVLEISGPFTGDHLPPIHRPAPAPPPSRPVHSKPPAKPVASVSAPNPPKVQNSAPSTIFLDGSAASRDRRSFLSGVASSTPGSTAQSDPDRKVGNSTKTPGIIGVESSRMLPSLSLSLDRRLKTQKVPMEGVNEREEEVPFVPLSPTKSGRKVAHSNSLKESQTKDRAGGAGEKLLKRESFRGTEISNPILVSTTNRDSQVFADFEFDESGIVARPPGSFGSNSPSTENVRDGCRSPVRRSQSDRPLSPKRRTQGVEGSTSSKKAPDVQQNASFRPRPLPPEPVLETEPLYINQGLSDLSDLKDCISSVFSGMDSTFKSQTAVDLPKAPPVPSLLLLPVANL